MRTVGCVPISVGQAGVVCWLSMTTNCYGKLPGRRWRSSAAGRSTTAHSGTQAQDKAKTERPDVILLDVMMPGVDGPSTVTALRAEPMTRDIPVIFLTAKMPPEDDAEWQALGLAGVIRKPFDPMTLSADMARLLGW